MKNQMAKKCVYKKKNYIIATNDYVYIDTNRSFGWQSLWQGTQGKAGLSRNEGKPCKLKEIL